MIKIEKVTYNDRIFYIKITCKALFLREMKKSEARKAKGEEI